MEAKAKLALKRSPTTFGNVFSLIPEGDDKHIRNAFYNVLAFLCLLIGGGIVVAVYFVLQNFLRPIAWALLFGGFLHPFKNKLSNTLHKWIEDIQNSQNPLLFSTIYSPLKFFATSTERIGDTILSKWKYILMGLGAVTCVYLAHQLNIIRAVVFLAQYFYSLFVSSFVFWIGVFSGKWVWALLIAYFVSTLFMDYDPVIQKYASYIIWILIFCNVTSYISSPYQALAFFTLLTTYIIGFLYDINIITPTSFRSKSPPSIEPESASNISDLKKNNGDQEKAKKKKGIASNKYLIALFWACIFIEFYKWILLLLPLAILIAITRRIESKASKLYIVYQKFYIKLKSMYEAHKNELLWKVALFCITFYARCHFGIWALAYDKMHYRSRCLLPYVTRLKRAFINSPIQGVYKLFFELDKIFINQIRNSIDAATTLLLMFLAFTIILTLAIFLCFQIYQESAHIVGIAHSALNSTLVENRWFQPSEQMEKSVDSALESGYKAGREWITGQFNTLNKQNNKDLTQLEGQILNLCDTIYDNVVKKGATKALSTSGIPGKRNILHSWQSIVESVTQVGSTHKDGIVKFMKDNIETLNSVLTTVWLIIKGNINLVFVILTNVFSFIFGGGSAILNLFLSWIIFLSTLLYFLSSSGEQYKPIQLFIQLMPGTPPTPTRSKKTPHDASMPSNLRGSSETQLDQSETSNQTPSGANTIAVAMQEAISGVFAATLKMATFYGLYTWLTHKVFGVGMVYIPAALGAIFAAVPFVGTYVASLPATLELWIMTGNCILPLIFFALHLLPKFFVDAAIYKEIKGGGHPYFTGLSIVGGIYMFGWEGALIGPMLLCCLFAGLKIFSSYMHSEPTASVGASTATPITNEDGKLVGQRPNLTLLHPEISIKEKDNLSSTDNPLDVDREQPARRPKELPIPDRPKAQTKFDHGTHTSN